MRRNPAMAQGLCRLPRRFVKARRRGGCGVLRWRRKTDELEQPRQAGNDGYRGEPGGDQDGGRGALAAAGYAKHERDKGRADRLAKEARRALDRAGPAAAMAWRARDDGAVVRRLEQAETGATQRDPPDDVGGRRVC